MTTCPAGETASHSPPLHARCLQNAAKKACVLLIRKSNASQQTAFKPVSVHGVLPKNSTCVSAAQCNASSTLPTGKHDTQLTVLAKPGAFKACGIRRASVSEGCPLVFYSWGMAIRCISTRLLVNHRSKERIAVFFFCGSVAPVAALAQYEHVFTLTHKLALVRSRASWHHPVK